MSSSSQVRVSNSGRTHSDNSTKLACLLRADVQEQVAITSDDMSMAYVGFNYAVPALEQSALPPVEPDFPAVTGRLAYCNGRYMYQADTVVSYRHGRRVVTEWHMLSGVRAA